MQRLCGFARCGVAACLLTCGAAEARTLVITTTQVTDADVAVSPDGKHLMLTILGHLFQLPAGGGVAEQLTFGPHYDADPTWSPDGHRVAFISDRDGSGGNVFVLEPSTGNIAQVTHEVHAGHPTWTPDGQAIIYLRFLSPREDPRPASIFPRPALCDLRKVALRAGSQPEVLRGPGLIRSVAHLGNNQLIWTVVEQEASPFGFGARSATHVETIHSKTGMVSRLRSVPFDMGRIAESPKGDGIYFRTAELRFLALPDGPEPLTPGFPMGATPATRFAVTRDGGAAYLSERGALSRVALPEGQRELLKLTARVTLEVADPAKPRWNPREAGSAVPVRGVLGPQITADGRELVFMAAGFLWQQPLDGGPARRLSADESWQCEPALSPDGSRLAYVRNHHGKRSVCVLNLRTGQTRTIAEPGEHAWARFLSWSRDGQWLVFQKSEGLQTSFALEAVEVSGGKSQRLASAAGDWSTRPHLNAPGDELYFTTRIRGPAALHRLALRDGARPEAVTELTGHLRDARVSADGRWLGFRRNDEIWVAPMGAGPVRDDSPRRLSPEGGATFQFTPDSSAVIYAAGDHVWKQPVDGGRRERLPVRLDWQTPAPPPLLIRRARVLDLGAGRFNEPESLLIERGVIRWIGSREQHKLPEGAVVLDAAGRFAIPGLFDFHVHSAWANYEANPDTFLAYGITSVRDTGGGLETLGALADRSEITSDPLPRYFYSGEIFEGAQPMWGDAFLQLDSADEVRDHVARWKARGAHFIKVYPSLPWPLQRAAADEARRQDLPVVGHGLGLEEIIKSVTLGYHSLEHCPMTLYDDVQQLLAASGTRCVPTLAILGGHSGLLRREPKRLDDPQLRAFFSDSFIRAAGGGGFPGMGLGRRPDLRDARRAGIRLHAGTDSLMLGTFFGASLHWELEHLAEAGLAPLQVLRAATQEAAAAVGAADELGTLAPGKLADLLLLDADPLQSIGNTQTIWRVVKGGWVYDPRSLRPATAMEPPP